MLKNELLKRVNHLQTVMEEQSLDAYIITAEDDIWYYTNITYQPEERPFFLLIPACDQPILIVPKLEENHVYKGVLDCKVMTYWDFPALPQERYYDVLNGELREFTNIGIEDNVALNVFANIAAKNIVVHALVSEQRKIKTAFEINYIKKSAKMTDRAMRMIFKTVYRGATMVEPFALSKNIQTTLLKQKTYDPITTSLLTAVWPAPISAMPHSVPELSDRIGAGPNVAMAYFRINGYAAECERTIFVGEPLRDEADMFHHMMQAREKSLALLKHGVRAADVDMVAREYLEAQGLKHHMLHRTGHGVGLGNHEAPFIAAGSDEVLKENMVITIEPGVYVDGVGGYRHSDTILMTKDGYELLTTSPLALSDVVIKKQNYVAKFKGRMMQRALNL